MDRIATFHVVRERPGRQVVVLARMVLDRWCLRRVDGLEFAKVLGTGRGGDTGPSADLRRQAYFLVWRDRGALEGFRSGHPVAQRWSRLDREHDLELALLGGRGAWSGVPVLEDLARAPAADGPDVLVLTRARIHPRRWRAFRRLGRTTADALADADGLHWAMGVGELPVGLLGTVSCWRSVEDLERFAEGRRHVDAVGIGSAWFGESLFARFAATDVRSRTSPIRTSGG